MGDPAALEVAELSFRYGRKEALQSVSFCVQPGEFCALLGPNGAGKSTLFALLTRLFVARQGKIAVMGQDLQAAPRAALARMGVVFQQMTLDLDLSVARNLAYFGALHGLSRREAALRAGEVLERLDMAERAREKARDLNGGHRRRLEIARALMHRPRLLLLDEPTVGLDARARASITAHVHALTRDDGLAVLWATHLVDEVTPGDTVLILHRGQIVQRGRAQDITPEHGLAAHFMALTEDTAA
ncbi:MAG: ABC-type transport system ATPase component [Roseibaca calidilacus]|uniref:ABC-2 type transport system ATP-binding protein n=1 Tax=Roseibaca calidilacus TaxID=1666912 RepID=A0A0P7YT61_9RHOB|nr:ABC transporter ATP-binding protein [Roseibaca calidilacus]KPP93511.1 MAG: ABC-type transport system ATPase component [Roseibaca calidilacus]CUX80537.1 ABC-2 type transport system ATP-binding protein [Roseibaca calidilacus]